ncbi:hypothetical protein KCP70_03020 [Salmonella enterica subsp. enterica]|nr:hypothetical protein KCP70_03020 [Salmonella enterica subsp. enterica]
MLLVRAENPDVQQLECSVFNGVYVTKDVDQQYLRLPDSLRNDDAKAVLFQNEMENPCSTHNEGYLALPAAQCRCRCQLRTTPSEYVFLYFVP